jgi:hypothetical protein
MTESTTPAAEPQQPQRAPAQAEAAPSAPAATDAAAQAPTRGERTGPTEDAATAEPAGRGERGERRRGQRGGRGGRGQGGGQPRPDAPGPASTPAADKAQGQGKAKGQPGRREPRKPARPTHPLLQTLYTLYPALFGARFLPLKVGIYEDLRAAHPEQLPAEELKVALGLHTRSNRYLEAVASGLARHDLQGQPTDPAAPEHVQHAIVELYRRKKDTPQEPAARERAVGQLVRAVQASGLGRDGYREKFGGGADWARALLEEALLQLGARSARAEALKRAYAASGKTVAEFAEMYGMDPDEVRAMVA